MFTVEIIGRRAQETKTQGRTKWQRSTQRTQKARPKTKEQAPGIFPPHLSAWISYKSFPLLLFRDSRAKDSIPANYISSDAECRSRVRRKSPQRIKPKTHMNIVRRKSCTYVIGFKRRFSIRVERNLMQKYYPYHVLFQEFTHFVPFDILDGIEWCLKGILG